MTLLTAGILQKLTPVVDDLVYMNIETSPVNNIQVTKDALM